MPPRQRSLRLLGSIREEVAMRTTTKAAKGHTTLAVPDARVSDVMRAGVVTCPPDTPLEDVARMLATYRIHCVVVMAESDRSGFEQPWGIVSDIDLAKAAANSALDRTAAEMAVTEVVTIDPEEPLERAAQLMAEHETAHLVVVDPMLGRPIGVVSTLDLAGVIGSRRETYP
jgi:CBS domain-containing protein